MKIIEYDKSYDEEIKDLLVELQEYLVEIDDWKTQVLYDNYREEIFKIDMRKVEKQKGKIYLAIENNCVAGLIIGVVESKDEIDIITNDCAITGKILELIVSKNSRGKGIGKELLNKMENYFNSINCERVTIEVFAPNKKAYNCIQHILYDDSHKANRRVVVVTIIVDCFPAFRVWVKVSGHLVRESFTEDQPAHQAGNGVRHHVGGVPLVISFSQPISHKVEGS